MLSVKQLYSSTAPMGANEDNVEQELCTDSKQNALSNKMHSYVIAATFS